LAQRRNKILLKSVNLFRKLEVELLRGVAIYNVILVEDISLCLQHINKTNCTHTPSDISI